MKFKVTKIAAAIAAGLGVSVVGTAQADSIMFPYFAASDTVTSIFSVINMAGPKPGTNATQLRYSYWYKPGARASSLTETCRHIDVNRNTSFNDVVTFDVSGRYADDPGVLFEPAARQRNAVYPADAGQSFSMMQDLPTRGFLLVVNDGLAGAADGTLQGEVFMIDFAQGAVWGYAAYNAAPVGPAANSIDFSDANERNGEVLAGSRVTLPGNLNVAPFSASVATPIMPIASDVTTGDIVTKFLVTPIAHDVVNPAIPSTVSTAGTVVAARAGYQDNGDLSATLKLDVSAFTPDPLDIMVDRDENPISGVTSVNVVCIGAVDIATLLDSNVVRQYGDFGGWTAIRTDNATVLTGATATAAGTRTAANNQAVIMKLEYNTEGAFIGDQFPGVYNTSTWLRRGIRESLERVPGPAGSGTLRITSANSGTADAPIWGALGNNAPANTSVAQ